MLKRFEKRVLLSQPQINGHEMKYIEKAFQDNWIVPLGPNVTDFENGITRYLGEENLFGVAMCSGTAAIHIALRLLNLQPNEEVFCSSGTFIATANPIMYEKAIPVFIDSESETWNLCPKSLQKAIDTKKSKGQKIPRILVCADLFGMSANYLEIEKICKENNIEIIEDSAESLGSSYRNKKCGSFGRFGILSFNGNKIITTSGGGMLITKSKEEADRAIYLITQAREKAPYYLHSEVGYNYRLSNICAGIGLGQLETLDQRVERRRRNFQLYADHLKNLPLQFLADPSEHYSNHWLSTGLIEKSCSVTATQLIKHLDSYNIEARHVWKPLHTQPVFSKNEFYHVEAEPISEVIFNRGICLPSGSDMTDDLVLKVCEVIRAAF